MSTKESWGNTVNFDAPKSILEQLENIAEDAIEYFNKVIAESPEGEYWNSVNHWKDLPSSLKAEADEIAARLAALAQQTGPTIRRSPLLTEADEREAGHAFKGMRAALRCRWFKYDDIEVLHDEGMVLGVQPAREYEQNVNPSMAKDFFSTSVKQT